MLGFLGRKGNQIIKGLPQALIERLEAKGAAGVSPSDVDVAEVRKKLEVNGVYLRK